MIATVYHRFPWICFLSTMSGKRRVSSNTEVSIYLVQDEQLYNTESKKPHLTHPKSEKRIAPGIHLSQTSNRPVIEAEYTYNLVGSTSGQSNVIVVLVPASTDSHLASSTIPNRANPRVHSAKV